MSIIPSSCEPNPHPFSIEVALSIEPEFPDLSFLLNICASVEKYAIVQNQVAANEIAASILRIQSLGKLSDTQNNKLTNISSKVLCERCQQSSINVQRFPFNLCDTCHYQFYNRPDPICFYCLCAYKNDKYRTSCGHFCIFCAAYWFRKGISQCEICTNKSPLYLNFLQIDLTCSKCQLTSKLHENLMLRLLCGHVMCQNCLYNCLKNKSCLIDNAKFQRDYAVKYLTGKCIKCCEIKGRKYFVSKTCCIDDVCSKCQKNKGKCHGCLMIRA